MRADVDDGRGVLRLTGRHPQAEVSDQTAALQKLQIKNLQRETETGNKETLKLEMCFCSPESLAIRFKVAPSGGLQVRSLIC